MVVPTKEFEDAEAVHINDLQPVLTILTQVAAAIAEVFGERCEVVVHDLRHPEKSIVHILNGHVSGRGLGGPLIGGPFNDLALRWLNEYGEGSKLQVYETHTRDGKRLRSCTVLFRDHNKKPFAALCINFDISEIAMATNWLLGLLKFGDGPDEASTNPITNTTKPSPPSSDVDDILQKMIRESMASSKFLHGKPTREQRFEIVKELDDRGAFLIKGAVQRLATALGVSKFTIYNDLEIIRSYEVT